MEKVQFNQLSKFLWQVISECNKSECNFYRSDQVSTSVNSSKNIIFCDGKPALNCRNVASAL